MRVQGRVKAGSGWGWEESRAGSGTITPYLNCLTSSTCIKFVPGTDLPNLMLAKFPAIGYTYFIIARQHYHMVVYGGCVPRFHCWVHHTEALYSEML